MAKIKIEIENCSRCPKFRSERHYTSDSWEYAFNWFCDAMDGKKIAGYVEHSDEKHIKIPNWCPFIVED